MGGRLVNKKPLISIIVPVYNAQLYLDRCIKSLLNQTYINIEIILINDGSTDNSGKLCDDYSLGDSRIKVIHQINKGAAEAKNIGLDSCSGEYISFVDSDDFINRTYIETLYQLIIHYEADLVQCLFQTGSNNQFYYKNQKKPKIIVFNENEIFKSKYYKAVVWGKLYKKDLFMHIRFVNNRRIDDEGVSYKNYYLANKVILTTEQLYYYYQSPNSIMRSSKKIELDFMDTFEERLVYFKNCGEKVLYDLSVEKYCIVLMLNYMSAYKNSLNSKNDLKCIMGRFNNLIPHMMESKYSNKKNIMILCLFKLFPNLSSQLRHAIKKR